MRCYCCNNGKWSYAIGGDIATRITRIFKLVERKAFVDFMGTEGADLKNGSLFSIFSACRVAADHAPGIGKELSLSVSCCRAGALIGDTVN